VDYFVDTLGQALRDLALGGTQAAGTTTGTGGATGQTGGTDTGGGTAQDQPTGNQPETTGAGSCVCPAASGLMLCATLVGLGATRRRGRR
jgi:hypothetical protein